MNKYKTISSPSIIQFMNYSDYTIKGNHITKSILMKIKIKIFEV